MIDNYLHRIRVAAGEIRRETEEIQKQIEQETNRRISNYEQFKNKASEVIIPMLKAVAHELQVQGYTAKVTSFWSEDGYNGADKENFVKLIFSTGSNPRSLDNGCEFIAERSPKYERVKFKSLIRNGRNINQPQEITSATLDEISNDLILELSTTAVVNAMKATAPRGTPTL